MSEVVNKYLEKYPEPDYIEIIEIDANTMLESRLPAWDCEYLRENHNLLLKNKNDLRADLLDKLSLYYAIDMVKQHGFDVNNIVKYVSALERI